jgi:two-component system, chemotaxis family, chemotaxis protein CheY
MPYSLNTVKILIVDDMQPMLTLCKAILATFGFKNVYTAQSGAEAIESIIRLDPDLIVTDWMMEPMDGLAMTREIRRNPQISNPYVPIIMMTGFSSKFRVENARDSGITEFLVKPFTARDLYNRIVQIIEKPRQFVDTGVFFGPDRRRKLIQDYVGPKRRNKDTTTAEGGTQKSAVEILKKLRDEAKNLSE